MSWARFLLRRIGAVVPALLVLSALIFAATELLPGDAVSAVTGPSATAAERAQVRQELGLDRPAALRYAEWVGGALRGDLGVGYVSSRPVSEVIGARLGNSALLAGLALLVAAPTAVALGLVAGFRTGRAADRNISTAALLAVSVPEFVLATALAAVLASGLHLVPQVSLVAIGGHPLDTPRILVLPVMTLAVTAAAIAARLVRASVADIAAAPYTEAARLRGVTGTRLALRHVLPNAAAPAVQALALVTGALVGGSVVVETLFGYSGVGLELHRAVANRDIPLVQGITLVLCGVTLLTLLAADIVVRVLDPRRGEPA